MAGITSTGLFSGIDANQLIEQLLQIESRPKLLAQQRLAQLQTQQAAYLDINSRLSNLKSAAGSFRLNRVFQTRKATTTDENVLNAVAGNRAQPGSYRFVVDRLVSSQQFLSRGFVDRDVSATGLDSITIESHLARLDRDTALADLNNADGVDRGTLRLNGIDVDLSRAGTVQDVLDAINSNDELTGVSASIDSTGFVVTGVVSVASGAGDQTAESLGLVGPGAKLVSGTLTGADVFGLGTFTSLSNLNDGRGVSMNPTIGEDVFDFTIDVGGTVASVRIGTVYEFTTDDDGNDVFDATEGAAANVGAVIDRMNTALTDAGLTDVTASINSASGRIEITDTLGRAVTIASVNSTAAEDLGIDGTDAGGTLVGRRVLAGMNSTLLSGINGGSGLGGDGLVSFQTADASSFTIDLSAATTLDELIDTINDDAGNGGAVTVSLNSAGTGLLITDNTTGAGDLVISGTGGSDSAASLGIAGTFTGGSARGSSLQLAWIGLSTRLDTLAAGEGVGIGSFRVTDSFGNSAEITIDDNDLTLNDVVSKINGSGSLQVIARVNDTGDGLIIEEDTSGGAGPGAIRIEDTEGVVARRLGILGEASGVDTENFIDGSYETTIDFEPDDTLDDIVRAINEADPLAAATIINDGSASTPFRLSFGAERTGAEGRFTIDTGDLDIGLAELDKGQDARVFFGSADAADGILLTSSSNTLDSVIQGVTIDLSGTSDEVVEVNVTEDLDAVEEKINEFLGAFNEVLDRIDSNTRFVVDTGERGPLLGDGTALSLRRQLINRALGSNDGFTGTFDRLTQVGINLGEGGRLVFDRDRFREAYQQDPDSVEDLFIRRDIESADGQTDLGNGITATDPLAETTFSALGVISQIEEFADDYITSVGGILTARKNALDAQILSQNKRIADFDVRLESRREVLSRQFLAMEQAIAQLQSQQSTLSLFG